MSHLRFKPIREWSIEDLEQIVREQWPEDSTFELKSSLPLSTGAKGWVSARTIHTSEREGIAKEVVALANNRGGLVVVGIEETKDTPKRAFKLATPIPQIHDLADRLSQGLFSSIDPPLRGLEIKPIESNDGSGYLVVMVPQSNSAPHGFGLPTVAYMREQDRSKPMSMREIQATFWESRTRLERMDSLRSEKSEDFLSLPKHQDALAYRFTAVPDQEIPLFSLHRRIQAGSLLPDVGQRLGQPSAGAAPWPFFNSRDWSPSSNCVRKKFDSGDRESKNGYWEIDVSGAVTVVGELTKQFNADQHPQVAVSWFYSTVSDLLTLCRCIARSQETETVRWHVDGEFLSTARHVQVHVTDGQKQLVNLTKKQNFRPVPIELTDWPLEVQHLEETISSSLQVPSADGMLALCLEANKRNLKGVWT